MNQTEAADEWVILVQCRIIGSNQYVWQTTITDNGTTYGELISLEADMRLVFYNTVVIDGSV